MTTARKPIGELQQLGGSGKGWLWRHLRAEALSAAGNLAAYAGDGLRAQPLLEESLALFQAFDEPWWIAYVRMNLGVTAVQQGNADRGLTLVEESLARFRELGDRLGALLLGIGAAGTRSDGREH